ncbi:MAG: iron-sulfur cluster assembly scaffold protein [Proteobacteria bacterium]|nr:iron-sulfur cluster assembly scaffold protein [Pseudomonadota bacterium]
MIDELYHKDLLRLAAGATGAGKLESPDATVTVDNPLCGDRVTIDIAVKDGTITALAHNVKGCVLCQAAAAVLGAHAVGETPAAVGAVRDAVRAMLEQGGNLDGQWPELSSFRPVAAHKSRHNCVLLPFQAVLDAADAAA